jgi:hypothetical protein
MSWSCYQRKLGGVGGKVIKRAAVLGLEVMSHMKADVINFMRTAVLDSHVL